MTSQKYASVPFVGTTWILVQTKAYIALIAKWYVTKFFSAVLHPAEAGKFELWRHSKKILTENRMKRANESLHCTDYEMVCDKNFFDCFTPGGSFQSSSYDVTAIYDVTSKMTS